MSGLIDPNNSESGFRYSELDISQHKFVDMWRVALYVISVFSGITLITWF